MQSRIGIGLLLMAVLGAALGVATPPGRGVVLVMPASGVVSVTNLQANSVWRPTVVAVRCPDVASRTVTVSRANGALEYPLAKVADDAQAYVLEFDATYWFAVSNVLRVTVTPPCTGLVEVVRE